MKNTTLHPPRARPFLPLHRAQRAFQLAANLFAVGRCIRCGSLLDCGDRRWGLCLECLSTLTPIEGDVCDICGMPLVSEDSVCLRCRNSTFSFDGSRAVYVYREHVAEAIRLYKLHNHPGLSRYFAQAMAPVLRRFAASECIVPVPGRPSRRRRYGWDQVDLLVRELSRLTGRPIERVLRRREGESQKSLDLAGRKRNLLGRISCVVPRPPSACVLVDDVFTTGATLSVCASVLKQAGSERVVCLVLAID